MNPNDAMYQVNIQNSWQIISYTVNPLILIHIIENFESTLFFLGTI